MPKFIIFLLISFVAGHLFLWYKVNLQLGLQKTGRKILLLLFTFPLLLPFALHFVKYKLPNWTLPWIYGLAYTWLGFFFYFLLFEIAGSIINNKGRKGLLFSIILGTSLICLYGLYEANHFFIHIYNLETTKLPPQRKRCRLIQLSDLHIDPLTSQRKLSRLVAIINQLEPDIIVLTGDTIDGPFSYCERFLPHLRSLKARFGKFAVSGNHEHYVGYKKACLFLKKANFHFIDNQKVFIKPLNIILLGLADPYTDQHSLAQIPILQKLLTKTSLHQIYILLYHRPLLWPHPVADLGIDLQLSGHTHKGQLFPFNFIIRLRYPFYSGHYIFHKSHLIVSNGTFTWGPPLRVLAPPEIVVVDFCLKS